MKIWKYEGLGNDFVIIPRALIPDLAMAPGLARRICDRHFGVGADGVLLLDVDGDSVPRMVVYNADGTRPEMCGNGLRCAAAHLSEGSGPVDISTDAGVYSCVATQNDGRTWVSVSMGIVSFEAHLAGVARSALDGKGQIVVRLGEALTHFNIASTGNPHAVTLVRDLLADLQVLARKHGPEVSTHGAFANGVNASWVRVEGGVVQLVVYERGAGMTLACGTGACAAVGVLARLGEVPYGQRVRVLLPGGPLEIEVQDGGHGPGTGEVTMNGPASLVFEGYYHGVGFK